MASKLVVDSSALVAVAFREPGWEAILHHLIDADESVIGAPTLLETSMVIATRLGPDAVVALELLVDTTGTRVVEFEESASRAAFDLFLRFGKGRHPAALNFGDCMSAGLAASLRADLFFVGDDFEKAGFPRLV